VDSVDVRIFCELAFREQSYETFHERHPSAAEIGKKIGLDEKTVRARISNMEESGFIKYYQASPALSLFGMSSVSLFRFEALNLSTKYVVINHLHDVPRLVESSDYIGKNFTARIAGGTEEEARKAAEALAARYELGTTHLGSVSLGESPARLDRLDWQIIKALRYDARSNNKDLAEALSVTQRMAGYRSSKLLKSGVVQTKAVIDPKRQAGLVFYELELLVDEQFRGGVSRWLRERFGQQLWSLSSPAPSLLLASLFSFTLAEPEDGVIEALRQSGVKRCLLLILKEVIEPKRPNWIDELIDLRISSHRR